MKRWLRNVFPLGASVASVPLVFFSIAIVALFQFPAQLLIGAGHLEIGVAANELFAVAAVPLLLIRVLKFRRRTLLPLMLPTATAIASVVLLTIGSDIVIDYLTAASELFIPAEHRVDLLYDRLLAVQSTGDVAIKLAILCLLPAVCEEIYFRGFCQTSLAHRWGGRTALLVAALIFAALHGNLYYVHLFFLLGLLLGGIYLATGSLWAAMLAHFLNNAWTFAGRTTGARLPLGGWFGAFDAVVLIAGIGMAAVGIFLLVRPRCRVRRTA